MSYPTNTENMLRYPEPMQHDLLNEQDQKFITDFFNTLATEEPPAAMLDQSHHNMTNVGFGAPSHNVIPAARGYQYGPGFEAGSTYNGANGYLYPIASPAITIPNNGYSTSAFQATPHLHNSFIQTTFPLAHQIVTPIHNGALQHVVGAGGKGKLASPLYIKSEPSIPTRRQRSPSPISSVNGTSSSSRHSPKRSNSIRRSTKHSTDNNAESNDNKSEENLSQNQQSLSNSKESSSLLPSEAAGSSPKLEPQGDGSTQSSNRGGRGKKGHHELLTEAEKKANHIASEQKRRQNIRLGFDQLVEIVPTLSQCHRSEALILQKSVEYIQQLLMQKNELKDRVKTLQATLGDAPDHLDDSSSEGELDLIF